jgi:1-phosphatidylinositol phosphodiesterase
VPVAFDEDRLAGDLAHDAARGPAYHRPMLRCSISLLAGLAGLAGLALGACTGADAPGPDWMADVADARGIAELSIPGTHDSGALYEPIEGLAKCQNLTIADQLAAGVRYFDVRCRHVDDGFQIYHGAVDQSQTFDQVLATMYAFLDAHPGETVIVSIKEEATPSGQTRPFEATLASYLAQAPERWYLAPALPRLGDVRGKLVLLRRFDATATPLGIDATAWPDNTTFSIAGPAALRVQDAYIVGEVAAKWTAITDLLAEAATADASTLYLDYTSGYHTTQGLSNVPFVADDINARLDGWLAEPAHRRAHLGVLVMDFVTPARAHAVLSTNLR